jgi:hypothetical protein
MGAEPPFTQEEPFEPVYEVLSPVGRSTSAAMAPVAGVEDLNNKKVAFVWDLLFSGDQMMAVIADELRARWPGVQFIGHENFENVHGVDEVRVVAELPARLKDLGADAAVIGVGACGSRTPAVMRAVAEVEKYGIPAGGHHLRGLLAAGPRDRTCHGPAHAAHSDLPRRHPCRRRRDAARQVRRVPLPHGLQPPTTVAAEDAEALRDAYAAEETCPEEIVYTGSLADVQDYFVDRRWSDGLPVVPPTRDAVHAMLDRCPHQLDLVLGELLPRRARSRHARLPSTA